MQAAISRAVRSSKQGGYPIGAVIVSGNEILARGHTNLHQTNDPTGHAEINAIRSACRLRNSRYLENCWLYSTQEPCPMCVSAAIWARMKGIVFGASIRDAASVVRSGFKGGASWRQIQISSKIVIARGTPKLKLYSGFHRSECLALLRPMIRKDVIAPTT